MASINAKIDRFRQEDVANLSQIKTDIALLKFQAALWGSCAGIIVSVIATIILKLLAIK